MHLPLPVTRELVLVGGGHTHALFLKRWAMKPLAGVQVTLVNPDVTAPYTGMLPGFVAGHYERSELDIDLVRLTRQAGARLIMDTVTGFDHKTRKVFFRHRPPVFYDLICFDIGISGALPEIRGYSDHVHSAKPMADFASAFEAFLEKLRDPGPPPNIVVIGGGLAGVELALALSRRLSVLGRGDGTVTILEKGDQALSGVGAGSRSNLMKALSESNIVVRTGIRIRTIERDHLILEDRDGKLSFDFAVGAAGGRPYQWLAETELDLEQGFIRVGPTLASTNIGDVFAVGDCAHMSWAPRPKAGVFAVRQAPVLFHNVRASLSGGIPRHYRPQKSYLKLISTGGRSAVADKFGVALSGRAVWHLKNRIDRAFMAHLNTPVSMPAPALPKTVAAGVRDLVVERSPHCGGCGAKVAQTPLVTGLSQACEDTLPQQDVRRDDAAFIERERGFDLLTTDHLRAFTLDPYLLARVAAVHAMGDVWAMGGRPHKVLASLIVPPLSEEKQVNFISEIMAGAEAAFQPCGTEIVGGHTMIGAELSVGFSVLGHTDRSPIRLGGGQPGDALILTKPIGTGTIMAAEMRQAAEGRHYRNMLDNMVRPQQRAADILSRVATAMTDVTGFGLAGHLMNMLSAASVAADIFWTRVPLLAGAIELHSKGIRSSLWAANAGLAGVQDVDERGAQGLLFDPQTSGGLLASVPEAAMADTFGAFEAAGEPIWQIGHLCSGPPRIHVK